MHEHTVTQHLKKIDIYTTHTQLRLRVLACIYHAYNKHKLSHTHATFYTQHTNARHTHILTLTHRKTAHTQQQHTHKHTWIGEDADRGAPVQGSFKSKG